MNWKDHSRLAGKHAILNPSGYSWINYDSGDDSKRSLYNRYLSEYSQQIGTLIHEFAYKRISYKMPLRKSSKDDLFFYLIDRGIPKNAIDMSYIFDNLLYYVNDAISNSMTPEVILYYSDNCFGCADAISFSKNRLRIHDLKNGRTPAHIEQLEIYAALFCLEYEKKPAELDIELRIYQPYNMMVMNPDVDDIVPIIDQIISQDKFLNKVRNEGLVM